MRIAVSAMVLLVFASVAANSDDTIPLEAYGRLPSISQVALSPNGKLIAFRKTDSEGDFLFVVDLASGTPVGGVGVQDINPRKIFFATNEKLILFASETARSRLVRTAWKASGAILYDFVEKEHRQLLINYRDIFPAQSGIGQVVGQSADGEKLYMPAYIGSLSSKPRFSLLEASLDSKKVRVVQRGTAETTDWFVDNDGGPLAEEVFDNDEDVHQVYSYLGGKRTLVYENFAQQPEIAIDGVSTDQLSLIFRAYRAGSEFVSHYQMSLENGDIAGPLFTKDGTSVEESILDINRVVLGVRYAGFFPTYRLIDDADDDRLRKLQKRFDFASVSLADWTPDFSKLLIHASGGWTAGTWFLDDVDTEQPDRLLTARPEITIDHVANTEVVQYEATDGIVIPALVTAKKEIAKNGNAALIVLPHGGPAAYDKYEFDWLAQYLASRGYVVLQPQFRGSTGFGADLQIRGHGEWGRKMSSDLDDGVRMLIENGTVNADRVCMLGASYGGYAALAAGAFSDFEYRCLISIAGVSDLRSMLRQETREAGRSHWLITHWETQFGASAKDKADLEAISPAKHAESFRAPVLLIHGRDDIVVPLSQSTAMYKALRRKKKEVTFIKLRGEDHFLTQSETRLQTLKAVEEFLAEHL